MKRVFGCLLLVIVFSSFVMAGSEISTNFAVRAAASSEVDNYVSAGGFWDNYGSYVIGVLIILVIVYVLLNIRSGKRHKKKSNSKKKSRKKK